MHLYYLTHLAGIANCSTKELGQQLVIKVTHFKFFLPHKEMETGFSNSNRNPKRKNQKCCSKSREAFFQTKCQEVENNLALGIQGKDEHVKRISRTIWWH
ncbi:hypothetical protein AMECASPLE_032336 [Ameca splendens]|uniref:Uncharacterized protein n=1 Tax=Ameca splendens TaxID=208324 RepID=A0ABV0YV50_9TELE